LPVPGTAAELIAWLRASRRSYTSTGTG
jgi:hypothetical protein